MVVNIASINAFWVVASAVTLQALGITADTFIRFAYLGASPEIIFNTFVGYANAAGINDDQFLLDLGDIINLLLVRGTLILQMVNNTHPDHIPRIQTLIQRYHLVNPARGGQRLLPNALTLGRIASIAPTVVLDVGYRMRAQIRDFVPGFTIHGADTLQIRLNCLARFGNGAVVPRGIFGAAFLNMMNVHANAMMNATRTPLRDGAMPPAHFIWIQFTSEVEEVHRVKAMRDLGLLNNNVWAGLGPLLADYVVDPDDARNFQTDAVVGFESEIVYVPGELLPFRRVFGAAIQVAPLVFHVNPVQEPIADPPAEDAQDEGANDDEMGQN